MPNEEYWTRRDGTQIAVGDMDVEHLRNALRMVLRVARKHKKKKLLAIAPFAIEPEMTQSEWDSMRDSQAYRDLANPSVFFPLIGGGVYGSPELQKTHGGKSLGRPLVKNLLDRSP